MNAEDVNFSRSIQTANTQKLPAIEAAGELALHTPERRQTTTSVGLILLNDRQYGIDITKDFMGTLHGTIGKLREGISSDEFREYDERVLDLGSYAEIGVVQTKLGGNIIETVPSMLTNRELLVMRFQATDILTDTESTYAMDEDLLLEFLTHRKGGIINFTGGGFPEESALVIEKPYGRSAALIAFLTPDKVGFTGITSIHGVQQFFREINEQFEQNGLSAFETNVLTSIQEQIARGGIKENSARLELLKAQLLGHARMYTLRGEQKDLDFIYSALPNLIPDTRGRVQRFLNPLPFSVANPLVNSNLTNSIYIDTASILARNGNKTNLSEETENVQLEEEYTGLGLQTEEAIQLYSHYSSALEEEDSYFGDNTSITATTTMDRFLIQLVEFINKSQIRTEYEDARELLKKVTETAYAGRQIGFESYTQPTYLDTSKYFNRSTYVTNRSVSQIAGSLLSHVQSQIAIKIDEEYRNRNHDITRSEPRN
ncbi:MAG: hypothetical protein ABIO02_00410, partial [Patescibacteria group bacterium]